MIKGYRSIPELDALHQDQHNLLFKNCLGVVEKIFSSTPTADQLPPGYCGLYVSGTTKRLYFNINGTIVYFSDSSGVTSSISTAISTALPSGVIAMWSGSVATIPSGWALCNGSNGTPDMRDKFIVGAGSTYAVAATGGATTHTLSAAEMPAHVHGTRYGAADYGTLYGNSTYMTDTNSGASQDTGSAGSGNAHNNLPPYYALAYIMKL